VCPGEAAAELIANAGASIIVAGGGSSAVALAKLQQQVYLAGGHVRDVRATDESLAPPALAQTGIYAEIIGSPWCGRSRDLEL
jgi:hypothetical protein